MKKSELTAFIKEEIKSTLTTEGVWSRGNDVEIQQFIAAIDQLKREFYDVVGSDDVFNGLDQAISAAQELAAMNEDAQTQQDIKDTEDLTKAMDKLAKAKEEAGIEEDATPKVDDLQNIGYDDGEYAFDKHFNKSILKNRLDTKYYSRGFVQAIIDSAGSLNLNEAEDKEPTKADLKKTKGLAKAKEELAQLTKQMKSLARNYKEAEGAEKEKIVADLKKKTKLKKELEAIIDK